MAFYCHVHAENKENILLGVRWVVWAIPVYDKHVVTWDFSDFGCVRRQEIVVQVVCQGDPTRRLTGRMRAPTGHEFLFVVNRGLGHEKKVPRGVGGNWKNLPSF